MFADGPTGAFALGLNSPNKPPVLTFRGTELPNLPDILADLSPQGVGFNQFEAIQSEVTDWLSARVEPAYLTGHSLGGALAQGTASAFTDSGNELGRVATFNSPGIRQNEAQNFDGSLVNDGITHYISHGDVVSLGGEEYNFGNWQLGSFMALDTDNSFTGSTIFNFIKDKHLGTSK